MRLAKKVGSAVPGAPDTGSRAGPERSGGGVEDRGGGLPGRRVHVLGGQRDARSQYLALVVGGGWRHPQHWVRRQPERPRDPDQGAEVGFHWKTAWKSDPALG